MRWCNGAGYVASLEAVQDDPLEASIRYYEWLVTRNLTFGPDGKRQTNS